LDKDEGCKKFGGTQKDNFCIIKQASQEVTISLWSPLTEGLSELHFNEKDIGNVLKIAKNQPMSNWHFFSKQIGKEGKIYTTQAYIGPFFKGEYFGWNFDVTEDGRILRQRC